MKLKAVLVCLSFLVSFGIAAEKAPAKNTKPAEADRVVCKKVKVTGSHFRQRICQKQSVWTRMEREAQRTMSRLEAGTTN